jgi:translation initiation factor eIF-2B subunit beta
LSALQKPSSRNALPISHPVFTLQQLTCLSLLKRRQISGPEDTANATAHLLTQVVRKSRWQDVEELLSNIQRTGTRLTRAAPRELTIPNVVRRVLRLVRDEASEDRDDNADGSEAMSYASDAGDDDEERDEVSALGGAIGASGVLSSVPSPPRDYMTARSARIPLRPQILSSTSSFMTPKSIFNLLSVQPSDLSSQDSSGLQTPSTIMPTPVTPFTPFSAGMAPNLRALRAEVVEGIGEIVDEIRQVDEQIAAFAENQILPGEVVVVRRVSGTVERFLAKAARERRFTVLFAVDAARSGGDKEEVRLAALRKKLAGHGVKSIVLGNSTLQSYMPRISKVILDARAVTASGGLLAGPGSRSLARLAKDFGKPVLVLGGAYKLCPDDPEDPEALAELGDPGRYVDFRNAGMVNKVDVMSLVTEYVPPELVSVYITNL